MFIALRHPTFRRLFAAHVVALLGTGLSTLAISFLVFDISGSNAAAILGTLMAIKMLTFLLLGPFAPVIAQKFGARRLLVATDLARAAVAVTLPFVDSIPVAYGLIFLVQSAAALFTPTFQAVIPTVVTDKKQYTGALALSRLAYDLEALASPTIAAFILVIAPSSALFFGTGIGFLASGVLILSVVLPKLPRPVRANARSEVFRGARLMLATPALRGTLTLHLALAAVGAIAIVLTVPLVRSELGGSEAQAASVLAAFGVGSIVSATLMTPIITRFGPRPYMLGGLLVMVSAMSCVWPALLLASDRSIYGWLYAIWFLAGFGNSAVLAPMGRVVRDSVSDQDLPHVFAAQFSLAHGWWLISYPVAGWGATLIGYGPMILILSAFAAIALLVAARLWQTPALPRDVETPSLEKERNSGTTK